MALTGTSLWISHASSNVEAAATKPSGEYAQWAQYGGSISDSQYSALKQINKSNAGQLQQVWFYPAGNNGFRYGSNPIVIDGVMYVWARDNDIAALDAATGKQLWLHSNNKPRLVSHRGLVYWESKDKTDRRILYAMNNELRELDARTGEVKTIFGESGAVDLRQGLGREVSTIRQIQSNTPGRVFDDLYLTGSATGEEYDSPPGDLRAYNIKTGKLVWQFHTVAHPGEMGYDTWPADAWKYIGGVNNWGEFSIDEKRAIVYFPLGSPTYDFYGADRHGSNLFSDCLLALDAHTGKYLWHFQTTHHDLWDYDLMTGPKLLTVTIGGKKVDVVAQAGKNGFLYVFDRVTGKPIFPIEEKPVPQSDVPGEESWPTQPIPSLPPFARQSFRPEDVDPYIADPAEREKIRKQVADARNEGIYTPPSLSTTMETPGNNGGGNWGSGSIDPTTGTLYVLAKNAPSLLHLEARRPRTLVAGPPENQGAVTYIQNCAVCHQANRRGQPPGIPSLEGIVDRTGADGVRAKVRNGAPPMPAFPDILEDDLTKLVAYLKNPEKANLSADVVARLNRPVPAASPAPAPVGDRSAGTNQKQRYWTGYGYMNSSDGLPAINPPWTTITAYDLNAGKIKWQIPAGGVTAMLEKGVKNTGGFWPRGGPITTAGGIIIYPNLSDQRLYFYDKDTGKEISFLKLPVGPEGIPAVYEAGGREYIAISARPEVSHGDLPTPEAGNVQKAMQGYYVFALPTTLSATSARK